MSAVDENSSLVLSMACKTDVGRTRTVNQDAFIMCNLAEPSVQITEQIEKHPVGDEGFLLAVADGMGGAAAGEVASKVAVEQIARKLSAPSQKSDMAERIADGLRSAHRAVRHASLEDERRAGMGATMTAVLVQGRTAAIGQVGDSRGYMIRGDEVTQVTKDQSLVQVLVDAGRLTEDQARESPKRNVVLQALGIQETVEPDVKLYDLQHGDHLMLCSDYLMQKVTNAELLEIVRSSATLTSACEQLVALANERGGADNITVLIAHFR